MIFYGHSTQVVEKNGGPPETRTPDPLIKSPLKPQTQATTDYNWRVLQATPCALFAVGSQSSSHLHAQNTHNRQSRDDAAAANSADGPVASSALPLCVQSVAAQPIATPVRKKASSFHLIRNHQFHSNYRTTKLFFGRVRGLCVFV
jgi:hypothetical protein